MENTIKLINDILFSDSDIMVDVNVLRSALEKDIIKVGRLPNTQECEKLVLGEEDQDEDYIWIHTCDAIGTVF